MVFRKTCCLPGFRGMFHAVQPVQAILLSTPWRPRVLPSCPSRSLTLVQQGKGGSMRKPTTWITDPNLSSSISQQSSGDSPVLADCQAQGAGDWGNRCSEAGICWDVITQGLTRSQPRSFCRDPFWRMQYAQINIDGNRFNSRTRQVPNRNICILITYAIRKP